MKRNPMTGLNSFFDDFFTKDLFNWNEKTLQKCGFTMPSVNVKETETHYEIEMAVPGLKKKILKLTSTETFLPFLLGISNRKRRKR